MNPRRIRQELRSGKSDDLDRRRKIVLLSALGLLDFSIISLYQSGVIRRLPDIPYQPFDTNDVNASRKAYAMGVPDGALSSVAYALNMALATAGGSEKASRKPVFDILLGATVLGNALGALDYLYDMLFNQKKVCLYCVAGAGINFASAAIIAPTVFKSAKKIFGFLRR